MPDAVSTFEQVQAYEAERAEIMARYTPRLKAMASNDPLYPHVWNERAAALAACARKHRMPSDGRA
jgi:hypothetical protein